MRVFFHHVRVVEAPQDGAKGPSIPLISHLSTIITLCCEVMQGLPRDLLQGVSGWRAGDGRECEGRRWVDMGGKVDKGW